MTQRKIFNLVFASFFSLSALSQNKFSPIGNWRGVFPIKDNAEIPFNFTIIGKTLTDAKLYFINGSEKNYGGKLEVLGDSLLVKIDQFDNELIFGIDGNNQLNGFLRKQSKKGNPIIVNAFRQKDISRFNSTNIEPITNISGKYEAIFGADATKQERTVGLFEQVGKKLTATFLRVSGDTRFLDGIIEGNTFYLSSFIGSSPSYYVGKIQADGSLLIEQYGLRGKQQVITAKKNASAELPNAFKLTALKNKNEDFNFSFPNADGKIISLNDTKYIGKPLIVTIGGTWCPNCMDEATFLSGWYAKNKARGIEVITIQYETQTDTAHVKKQFSRFKKRFNIQYEQVLGGVADKKIVMQSLPALDTFISFPTTLFIDKNRKVTKVHTGFSGPATGKFYINFIKEFNEIVNELLQ